MLFTTSPASSFLAGSKHTLGYRGAPPLFPFSQGPSHCVNEARTPEARAGFIGVGVEVGKRQGEPAPPCVLCLRLIPRTSPQHRSPALHSQDWRVVSEMPPGGDGDSGEKELWAEVYGSFCLGCHTPVTGRVLRGRRGPPNLGRELSLGVTTYPSSSETRNFLLLAKSLDNHFGCCLVSFQKEMKSQWVVN